MRVFLTTLLVAGLLLLSACTEEPQPEPETTESNADLTTDSTGDTAAYVEALNVSGPTLDGGHFDLAELRGKVVFLNFFATWCPPCKAEIPDLSRLSNDEATRMVIVGIGEDQNAGDVLPTFVAEMKIDYPVIAYDQLDNFREVLGYYYHEAIPSTFVIAPDGSFGEVITGSRDYATFKRIMERYSE